MQNIGKNVKIAKSAIIEDGAFIGDNVEIGEYSTIGAKVRVGNGCKIGSYATITGRTTLGENNKIFNYAAVGTPPQDLKYAGEDTALVIGDSNLIREFTTINIGTTGGHGVTTIGDGNLFMAYTHVAHDCVVGNECILANIATLGGHVVLGDYVNLGGLSAVHQFCQIGKGSMLAGGSILTQDLPPFCIAEGSRAYVRSLNKHRMRRLFDNQEIDEISHLYKLFFTRTIPLKDIVNEQLAQAKRDSIKEICNFILNATRGVAFKTGHKES